MVTMASGSTESMLRTGLDAAVHAHIGWDLRVGLPTLPNLERIIIGTDYIFPLLDTRRVKGNCDIGKIVCERVFERPWDPSQSKREEQWYGNGTVKYHILETPYTRNFIHPVVAKTKKLYTPRGGQEIGVQIRTSVLEIY